MLSEFSEEAGVFRFQFMSNEREFASIIPSFHAAAFPMPSVIANGVTTRMVEADQAKADSDLSKQRYRAGQMDTLGCGTLNRASVVGSQREIEFKVKLRF